MEKPTQGGKARLIKLGVAIAVVAAGLFAYRQWAQHTAQTQAEQHHTDVVNRIADEWSRYSRCLLGAPLAAKERASQRFRNIVLAAPPATGGQPAWPERCNPHREAMEMALRDAEGREFLQLSRLRKVNVSFPHPRRDSPGNSLRELDDLWTEVADAGLPTRDGGEVPLPPAPVHTYASGELPAVSAGGSILEDRAVGPDVLDILGDDQVCRFTAASDAISARCAPIKKPADPDLAELRPIQLFSTLADQPPLVALYGETAGAKQGALFLGWDGTLIHKSLVNDASARSGGKYDILITGPDVSLVAIREGHPPQQTKVGNGRTGELIDDWAVWIDAGRVYATHIEDSGPAKPVEVGPFNKPPTNVHYYCALADGTRVIQFLSDDGRNLVHLKDGVWSAPRVESGVSGIFVCAGDTYSMAWATWPKGGERSIHRATCTKDACQRSEGPLPAPANDRKFSHLLPLGEQILAIFYHPDDGGLRYRLAKVDALASAPEVIVHDDTGYGPPVFKPEVYPLGGRALVLYGSTDGLHGLEIGADGGMKPVPPATN